MAQRAVEAILIRQLAGYLSIPVIVIDTEGTVIYYNEPAEGILGIRYEETGRLTREQFEGRVTVAALDGTDVDIQPLRVAIEERRPAHALRRLIRRSDGAQRTVEVTAFPLMGQGGTMHGAVAMFWEQPA